jgi:N-acetyltransferase 10
LQDVHSRYRTEGSTSDPVARFNERFILSLGSCHSCLVLDDELNVLPISAGKDIEALPEEGDAGPGAGDDGEKRKKVNKAMEKSRALGILRKKELEDLKVELAETKPTGEIIKEAKTVDQVSHDFRQQRTEHGLSMIVL